MKRFMVEFSGAGGALKRLVADGEGVDKLIDTLWDREPPEFLQAIASDGGIYFLRRDLVCSVDISPVSEDLP